MKKEKVFEQLKEALKTEESVIEIYMQHLKVLSGRFPMDKKDLDKIKSLVGIMIEESRGHKKACEKLLLELRGEKRDDI